MKNQVLVLDSGYIPRGIVSKERAFTLVMKGSAHVVETSPTAKLRSAGGLEFDAPEIIRVNRYIRVPYRRSKTVSRRAIYERDGYRCVYCGSETDLTLDHVHPKSKGGTNEASNLVTACFPCNVRKGSSLISEIGYSITRSSGELRDIPESWKPYYI